MLHKSNKCWNCEKNKEWS